MKNPSCHGFRETAIARRTLLRAGGMGLLGLAGFFWAMRKGQFDDLDGAAQRILIDDEEEDESE